MSLTGFSNYLRPGLGCFGFFSNLPCRRSTPARWISHENTSITRQRGARELWLPPAAAPRRAALIRGGHLQQLMAVMQPCGRREGRSNEAGRGGTGSVRTGRGEPRSTHRRDRRFPPHPMRAATGLLENSNQSGRRVGTEPSDWTAASPRLG